MKQSRTRKGERSAAAAGGAQLDDAAVARRAYELYLERGAETGHDLDDWLKAEAELRSGGRSW